MGIIFIVYMYLLFPVEAGPPGQPQFDEITKDSVTLSWEKPQDDGGGKIKGYIVEKKKENGEWEEVTLSPVKDTTLKVGGYHSVTCQGHHPEGRRISLCHLSRTPPWR